jgi:hypothetical protein
MEDLVERALILSWLLDLQQLVWDFKVQVEEALMEALITW